MAKSKGKSLQRTRKAASPDTERETTQVKVTDIEDLKTSARKSAPWTNSTTFPDLPNTVTSAKRKQISSESLKEQPGKVRRLNDGSRTDQDDGEKDQSRSIDATGSMSDPVILLESEGITQHAPLDGNDHINAQSNSDQNVADDVVSSFADIPNEIVAELVKYMGNVEAICFALTSRRNYDVVNQLQRFKPKEDFPREGYGDWYTMRMSETTPAKELICRLALWLPEDSVIYFLRGRANPCITDLSVEAMKKKDKPFQRRFFRELSFAKNLIRSRLRGMEQRAWRRRFGVKLPPRHSKPAVTTSPAKKERDGNAEDGDGHKMALRSHGLS